MCLYPRLIQNPKYKPNKKNGGKPPKPSDKRVMAVPIGCGQCIECRKQKANHWRVRLNEELRSNKDKCYFVTLTFSDESLDKFKEQDANLVCAKAIELFRKRWYKKHKEGIKHWLIVELGHPSKNTKYRSTERVHLHGFIWTNKPWQEVEKTWEYGSTDPGEYVNEKSINYCVKYVTKIDADHIGFIGKIFTSKGIGKSYMQRNDCKNNKYNGTKTNQTYRTPNGTKVGLPIYYKNKIYTEEQREQLWINKLNKQERWVLGNKIKIDKGVKEYLAALQAAQEYNIRLGYPKNPWIRKNYTKKFKNYLEIE